MFGLETEFGIARGEHVDLDVVAESIALVRSAAEPGVLMRWDYAAENPHRDMRGFDVEELGLQELAGPGVLAVEWAERWDTPPRGAIAVHIVALDDESREITIGRAPNRAGNSALPS